MTNRFKSIKAAALAFSLVLTAASAHADSQFFFRWVTPGVTALGASAAANCTLPWGATLGDGQSAAAYEADHVSFGNTCNSESRACADGALSGSFQHQSCVVDLASNCTAPWGAPVAHTTEVAAFQTASVPFSSTCSSEQRVCFNGTLSGTFGFQTCSADVAANCTTPWNASVLHGETTTAYQTASVPFGSTCASEIRSCSNGTLNGSYAFESCTVAAASNCTTPWGATVLHGGNTTAYQTASVSFGSTCSSQVRSCSDGTLSGSYTFQTCTVAAAANCTTPWGATVLHDQTTTAYQTASVPYGSTCTSEVRACSNGTLSGSFANQTCAAQAPANCAAQAVSWNSNCSGSLSTGTHGSTANATNTAGGFTGTGNFTCSNGTWQNTGGTCASAQLTCNLTPNQARSGGTLITQTTGSFTAASCSAWCLSHGAQAGNVCAGSSFGCGLYSGSGFSSMSGWFAGTCQY